MFWCVPYQHIILLHEVTVTGLVPGFSYLKTNDCFWLCLCGHWQHCQEKIKCCCYAEFAFRHHNLCYLQVSIFSGSLHLLWVRVWVTWYLFLDTSSILLILMVHNPWWLVPMRVKWGFTILASLGCMQFLHWTFLNCWWAKRVRMHLWLNSSMSQTLKPLLPYYYFQTFYWWLRTNSYTSHFLFSSVCLVLCSNNWNLLGGRI